MKLPTEPATRARRDRSGLVRSGARSAEVVTCSYFSRPGRCVSIFDLAVDLPQRLPRHSRSSSPRGPSTSAPRPPTRPRSSRSAVATRTGRPSPACPSPPRPRRRPRSRPRRPPPPRRPGRRRGPGPRPPARSAGTSAARRRRRRRGPARRCRRPRPAGPAAGRRRPPGPSTSRPGRLPIDVGGVDHDDRRRPDVAQQRPGAGEAGVQVQGVDLGQRHPADGVALPVAGFEVHRRRRRATTVV